MRIIVCSLNCQTLGVVPAGPGAWRTAPRAPNAIRSRIPPKRRKDLYIPLSENNLTGGSSKLAADNQMVPEEGAYLVGVATVRGVTRRVKALVHLPPFPFAAASDGPIVSPGSLVVGSLRPGQDPSSSEPLVAG